MLDLYVEGRSALHRLGPGWKILGLAFSGTVLFAVDHVWLSILWLAISLTLYAVAELPLWRAWRQIRPVLWLFALIFVVCGSVAGFGCWDAKLLGYGQRAAFFRRCRVRQSSAGFQT